MPSSPLALAAAREEQQKQANSRIAGELAEAHARPQLVRPFKADQQTFAPDNVLTRRWRLNLPHGTPYEAVFHPECFSIFHRLEPGMRIEVWPEDASYVAELIFLQHNGPRTRVYELSKIDLPDVGPSGTDGVTGGYQSFHVGGGKWKVKRLEFVKPNGTKEPERTYPDTFNSDFDAQNFIRLTLIGTR